MGRDNKIKGLTAMKLAPAKTYVQSSRMLFIFVATFSLPPSIARSLPNARGIASRRVFNELRVRGRDRHEMTVSAPVQSCPESDTSNAACISARVAYGDRRTKGHSSAEWPFKMCVKLLLNNCDLVAVVLGLVGAFNRHAEIIGLLLGKGRELDADLFQVQTGDLLVQRLDSV